MKAFMQPAMIKVVSDAFLKNDELMAPIATFVSNYVQWKTICIIEEKEVSGSRRKFYELHPSPQTSDSSDDDDMTSKHKKTRQSRYRYRDFKKSNSFTSSLYGNVWNVMSSGKSIEGDDLSSLSCFRK